LSFRVQIAPNSFIQNLKCSFAGPGYQTCPVWIWKLLKSQQTNHWGICWVKITYQIVFQSSNCFKVSFSTLEQRLALVSASLDKVMDLESFKLLPCDFTFKNITYLNQKLHPLTFNWNLKMAVLFLTPTLFWGKIWPLAPVKPLPIAIRFQKWDHLWKLKANFWSLLMSIGMWFSIYDGCVT
jgi:hypothetical protein